MKIYDITQHAKRVLLSSLSVSLMFSLYIIVAVAFCITLERQLLSYFHLPSHLFFNEFLRLFFVENYLTVYLFGAGVVGNLCVDVIRFLSAHSSNLTNEIEKKGKYEF